MEQPKSTMSPSAWDLPDLDKDSRVYQIQHKRLHIDYLVTPPNGEPLLYVENSYFTPGKPDLTFRRGADNRAPVVSVCKFPRFSRRFKVCLGNPLISSSVEWEDLESQSFRPNKFKFHAHVDDGSGMKLQSFLWKKSLMSRDSHLIDDRTGATVAVFNSASFSSLRKVHTLEIQMNYGRDFELMVLTTGLAVFEKQRRTRAAAAAGAAGGGGGGA